MDAVIAGDVICDQIHAMLGLSGPDEGQNWIASVDQIERLRPVDEMVDGTRSYISDFAEAAQSATDANELVATMLAKD